MIIALACKLAPPMWGLNADQKCSATVVEEKCEAILKQQQITIFLFFATFKQLTT
jgi:hypothetical protein